MKSGPTGHVDDWSSCFMVVPSCMQCVYPNNNLLLDLEVRSLILKLSHASLFLRKPPREERS